jgi:putative glycosyltransferase
MYHSAPYLAEFYARARSAARNITDDYEFVFVNDGSPDNSLEIVLGLFHRDDRVRIIDLSRNLGHHKAVMTGLAHARGDLIFLVGSDLEEDRELLEKFYDSMKATGADVVDGVQQERKGGSFKRLAGEVFYFLFNLLSSYPVPKNVLTARLMTRRYVANLVRHRDRELFLLGLLTITGFEQVPLFLEKQSKASSAYTLGRKIALFVNAITSFSSTPLVLIFYLGRRMPSQGDHGGQPPVGGPRGSDPGSSLSTDPDLLHAAVPVLLPHEAGVGGSGGGGVRGSNRR